MVWGLYSSKGEPMPPRTFTTGKTQEETVDEILEKFEDNRIVLLKGGVGSGKSIIGATVAGALGKGVINVPVKPLQEQYQRDYEGRLHIKIDGRTLKIRVLKGRSNFTCRRVLSGNVRCSSRVLPCTVPLDKTTPRWKEARKCKRWSPIYPHDIKPLRNEKDCKVLEYKSLSGTQYVYQRGGGCGYYDQNLYYLNSDILIYNNAKWHADSVIGRKPDVDVEIFDEADLFLDGLTLRSVVSERIMSILLSEASDIKTILYRDNKHDEGMEIESLAAEVKKEFVELVESKTPSQPYDFNEDAEHFVRKLLEFLKNLETEYAGKLIPTLEDVLTYSKITSFYTEEDKVTFFVPEPSVVTKDVLGRTGKKILFMSATMQEPSVLKEIYGLDDFALVEGETRTPGKLYAKRTDEERVVNWKSWQDANFQEWYWKTLSRILNWAEKPMLVQVHSYQYLPKDGAYPAIPSRSEVKSADQEAGILAFKAGEKDVLFSTKTDRGIDLPGAMCRAIVIMKYPFPSISDPLFTVMKKRLGDRAFWKYYGDIARRDLHQQIGRGLRSDDDWIEVWSPDLKVHQELMRLKG